MPGVVRQVSIFKGVTPSVILAAHRALFPFRGVFMHVAWGVFPNIVSLKWCQRDTSHVHFLLAAVSRPLDICCGRIQEGLRRRAQCAMA